MGHFEDKRLWSAIGTCDADRVEEAIKQGANPNSKGSPTLFGKETALQRAASLMDDAAIEVLLKHGARQSPGRHKATPLIALVLAIRADSSFPETGRERALRALDLLLSKRPNLEAYGGEQYDKGTVLCHALRLPDNELGNAVLDRLIDVMARQKKALTKEFSQMVLSSAFRHRDLATFKRLVDAGADPKALSEMGYPPPLDLLSGAKESEADDWWRLFAEQGVSVDNPGFGVSSNLAGEANARLLEERMRCQLDPAPETARYSSPRL